MRLKKLLTVMLVSLGLISSLPAVSADASHTYHSEMITRSFYTTMDEHLTESSELKAVNHKADKWTDSISDINKYRIMPGDITHDGRYAIETVHLVRKHQSATTKILEKISHTLTMIRNVMPS